LRRDGLVARGEHGEHGVEARDLEDATDLFVGAADGQLAGRFLQALAATDQHAQGRRVDEAHVGQVDDDALGALVDGLQQDFAEARRGVQVDFADEDDHSHVVRRPVECHRELLPVSHLADPFVRAGCRRRPALTTSAGRPACLPPYSPVLSE
jgi:hypothetical protein